MSRTYINITQWPTGMGLDLEDPNGGGSYAFAGPHGGGIGTTLTRVPVDIDNLKAAIKNYEEMEERLNGKG